MMSEIIDDRTTNLSLQLPHRDNDQEIDVVRLRNALTDIDSVLKYSAANKGVIPANSTVTFSFSDGELQTATFQTGPVTIAINGYVESRPRLMMLQLNGAGLVMLNFPTIYWVVPDGTYTTNIATYMSVIGREALSTTLPTWILVWQVGENLYGKML